MNHLLESVGLDVEICSPRSLASLYNQAYDTILDINTFLCSESSRKSRLILPATSNLPVIDYSEAISMLNAEDVNVKFGDDLGLVGEEKLSEIIKQRFNSDAFVITHYPDTIKKFYTKRKQVGLTETFDIIVDGWELVSGAIRNTNKDSIDKIMTIENLNRKDYDFYLSVIDGAPEHGGFCLGLDRILAKSLGYKTVKETTPFPRTHSIVKP